jgi:hypothetical protein
VKSGGICTTFKRTLRKAGVSNFNTLINKIKKKEPIAEDLKTLYFNDKYIFIEALVQNKKNYSDKKNRMIFLIILIHNIAKEID